MQIAKLLIVPFVCLVEKFWLGREFTRGIVIAVLVVVTGVAVVYVAYDSLLFDTAFCWFA